MENGIFRLNKVDEEGSPLDILNQEVGYQFIPEGYVNYETNPREYVLNPISTIVKISTQVSDIYRRPYDQSEEQLRLSVECLRERQDYELVNSRDYGLLANAAGSQRIQARNGYPTPDDLDELITTVWEEPSFSLPIESHRRLRKRMQPDGECRLRRCQSSDLRFIAWS